MTPLVSPLLAAVRATRRSPRLSDCLVCGDAVRTSDAYMRAPAGGYVHRGCSTYRTRQREAAVRRVLG